MVCCHKEQLSHLTLFTLTITSTISLSAIIVVIVLCLPYKQTLIYKFIYISLHSVR